jgi:hypothetical protein
MMNKHYPLSNTCTVGVEFFKINMEAAGLNDFWHCLKSHERSFSQVPEIKYPVRGITYGVDTDWFYLIQLERSGANPWFFDDINNPSVNIKITGTFLKAFDENGALIGLRDNIFILNEDNFEPNSLDLEYKGGGTAPNVVQEINIASPILITVRDTYFLLNVDQSIRYIATESWIEILPHYYSEIFPELQEKEAGQEFSPDYNSGNQTTKYY